MTAAAAAKAFARRACAESPKLGMMEAEKEAVAREMGSGALAAVLLVALEVAVEVAMAEQAAAEAALAPMEAAETVGSCFR